MDDLVACSSMCFLDNFASKPQLTRDLILHVKEALKQAKILDSNGWTALAKNKTKKTKGRKAGKKKNESDAFSFLGPAANAISTAATKYNPELKPRTNVEPSSTQSSHRKAGYRSFPDWRGVGILESVPLDTNSKSVSRERESVDTADISAVFELKLEEKPDTIRDVRLCCCPPVANHFD